MVRAAPLPERRVDGCPENVLDRSGDCRAPCDTILPYSLPEPSGAALVPRVMDALALLLVPTNLALVIAFYAERRGAFDVDDESNSPRGLRPVSISMDPPARDRRRGLGVVP